MPAVELEALLRAAVPAAPDRLRARVRELRPAPRRLPTFDARRLLLVGLPAAVVLVVGAAVVHGLTTSSSRTLRIAATTVQSGAARVEKTPYGAVTTQQHGVGTLSAGAGTAAPLPATGGARLTRYEASLRLRVDGVQQLSSSTHRATQIVRSLGGYAASVEYRTPAGRPGSAFLELRVPTARVQDALARLSGLGTILSQRLSVRDLQRELERETAQIAQLQESIRLTIAALKDPALTPVQRIELQLKLAEAKRALAQRTHARTATVADGTLARVSLALTTAAAAGPVAPHHEGRLGRMLGDAVSFLGLEATIGLYALVVISPFALLTLVGWAGLRIRRRRDEKRLLLSS
jgi:hypothetical protein